MSILEKTLLDEVNRYKQINKYIVEQADPKTPPPPPGEDDPNAPPPPPGAAGAGTPPPGGEPSGAGTPPELGSAPGGGGDLDGDIGGDFGGGGGGAGAPPPSGDAGAPPAPGGDETPPASDTTEEVDVTDLVNMTKNIKQHLEDTKNENNSVVEKMDGVFNKLSELESKLSEMDSVLSKIDQLGAKIDQMKPPTPIEKLEMRSLDSYPFSQKPDQFFDQKQGEMRASGKNEYVLTKDDVENYAKENIMKSFNPDQEEDDQEYHAIKY